MPNTPIAPASAWDFTKLDDFGKRCSGSPVTWPHRSVALWAVLDCLEAVSPDYPDFAHWVHAKFRVFVSASAPDAIALERNLLRGESKSYAFHLLLLELRKPHRLENLQGRAGVRKLLGFWSLCLYLSDWEPTGYAVATVKGIATSAGTESDTLGQLERYIRYARKRLLQAIELNPIQAAEIGLISTRSSSVVASRPDTLWGSFNADLRRHWATHIQDASSNRVRAMPGKDALTAKVLHHAGHDLRSRVRAGDCAAIASSLQIITRLPVRLLTQLPLQCNSNVWQHLAHIDLEQGRYVFDLRMVVDLSEDPPEASSNLFVTTSPGLIYLPAFLWKSLRSISAEKPGAVCLGDLIDCNLPNPRSTLIESHGHKITLSRIQSTFPAVLLNKGAHRWPTAIATQSWWLVSKGRRAYSVCSQNRINELTTQVYEHLGWGSIVPGDDASHFIGSALTPRLEALRKIAEFLSSNLVVPDQVRTVEHLNQWAAYCTFLATWFLALRARERYPIDWIALAHARHADVNDKDVHLDAPPPIPVISQLREMLVVWNAVVAAFVANVECKDPVAVEQRQQIEFSNRNGTYPLFSVDGIATIRPAGTDTWRRHLPAGLRPAMNFGRHFWPWRLMERGVIQRQVDLLMRHQTTYLDPYGPKRLAILEVDSAKLRAAMEAEIFELLGPHFLNASNAEGKHA